MSNYNQISNSNVASVTQTALGFSQVTEASGNVVYKQADYFSVSDRKTISQIPPTTSVPANLANAQIDFSLTNVCDVIDHVGLEFVLTNSTGAAATFTAAPLFLQRLDIIAMNGSVIMSMYGDDIYMANLWMDRTSYEAISALQDLSPTTYQPLATSLANGSSVTLEIPIYGFFKAVKLASCGLNGPITLRAYFNPSSMYLASGADCTCSSLNLIVYGRRLKENARNSVKALYQNGRIPLSLSHLTVDRMSQTLTLSANQTINIPLNGLSGVCSYFTFTVRLASTANTAAGIVTYIPMASYDILDTASASIIGFLQRNRNQQKIAWADNYGNNAMIQTGIHHVSHCASPKQAFATGANSGFYVYTSNETLRFLTPSTLSTASYIIDMKCYMYENIQIFNNQIKVSRS